MELNEEQREELKIDLSNVFNDTKAYRKIDKILNEKFGNDFDICEVVLNWEESLINHIQDQLDQIINQ
jgi:hypothetical protein